MTNYEKIKNYERCGEMKAYDIRNKYDGFIVEVIFAETAGKAKSYALQYCESCEESDFCDLNAKRNPQIDKYYTGGKRKMDWCNQKDRLALVKECDFVCDDECFDSKECEKCIAKKYCGRYEEYLVLPRGIRTWL